MAAARVGRQADSSCVVQLLLAVTQYIWGKCLKATALRSSAAAGRLTLPPPCRRRPGPLPQEGCTAPAHVAGGRP